jgi:sigma-E factor negative regulatory protein RseC
MLETRAIVIKLEGDEAVVESLHGGGCGSCSAGNGCGKMSEMFCVKPRQFRVRNGIGAQVGEEVEVAVADGALLRSALILYAMPMALLFAGALSGAGFADGSDAGAAMGAVAGLLAGFALARVISRRQRKRPESYPAISRCGRMGKSAIL